VIAATNKDLAEEISLGNFREDLYYRLNVIPFHLPPLRERSKDVLALTNFFLDQIAADLREPRKTLSAETLQVFLSYSWPGNIRQLRNVIERLYILTSGPQVGVEDLPSSLFENSASDPSRTAALGAATLKEAKNDFERAYILGKLQEFQWNVSKTAEAIGIERSNLHRKLRAYDIDPKRLKG
jgi:two-component system nitrogen regulation response regulator NtrX